MSRFTRRACNRFPCDDGDGGGRSQLMHGPEAGEKAGKREMGQEMESITE